MDQFLQQWAALSFVSMSGNAVRKFEGHMLDNLMESVERVESLPSADDLDRVAEEESVREATNG